MSDGDPEGFAAYVRGRAATLRRSAYLLCGDTHQADDLVQEALTTVYSKWRLVSRADNVDAYVQRILVRTFINERRRGWWKVRLFGSTAPDLPESGPGVEERQVLRAALSRLTPGQQAVLVLRFLCDRSVADVAMLLDCSEGNVKSQTSHALTALRKILGTRQPEMTLKGAR
ncbi:SigE family RNA polymerase sigma factor [Winogradskya humida]|uniref:RNA polymerase sigma24 factor n=1 Tax=Winogradskya humida TaxID=113566 RepID=A0ABQ3ZFT2_9ACTN|nr:SigE family RNA polymerase sigma factor [Actinoplanes humidus]GIE17436.1 RNA polymerase sigma24 factor [Actinoplanes humidus]